MVLKLCSFCKAPFIERFTLSRSHPSSMFARVAPVVNLKVEVGTVFAVPSPWVSVVASIPGAVQAFAPVDVVTISVSTHPVIFPYLRISSLVRSKLLRSVYFITHGADPVPLPWLFAKITVNNIS